MDDVDDRPVVGTEVQLTPITRGVSLAGSVESLVGATPVVRPSAPELAQAWTIGPGAEIEALRAGPARQADAAR